MNRVAYSLLLGLGLAAASPILVARLAKGRYRSIALARLGLGSRWLPRPDRPGAIWVHALSVGEVKSALPLLDSLGKRFPGRPLAFSAATAQGLAVAGQALSHRPEVSLFVRPLDTPWGVSRVLERLSPGLFCLVEGDIWPGWQWALAKRRVPRLLVNSRVSPRTFKGYQRFKPLARQLFAGFDRVLTQTKVDRDRLAEIGVPAGRLGIGGNLKFDSAPQALSRARRERLADELGLGGKTVLVAGSTHEGEEAICLKAFSRLAKTHEGLALVLAPREVGRGAEAARLSAEMGFPASLASRGGLEPGRRVLVLDVLGRLARVYALGRAAFVGGTFAPIGGHNLLEPAAQGVPTAFGPHTHNFLEMARQLEKAGGGLRLPSPDGLAAAWGAWLDDPLLADRAGRAGMDFCRAHQGALDRAVGQAAKLLAEYGS